MDEQDRAESGGGRSLLSDRFRSAVMIAMAVAMLVATLICASIDARAGTGFVLILPWLIVLLVGLSGGRLSLIGEERATRGVLGLIMLVPITGAVVTQQAQLIDSSALDVPIAAGAFLMTAVLLAVDRGLRHYWLMGGVVLVFAAFWSWALMAYLDWRLDRTPPREYRTTVTDKHFIPGRHPDYELTLGAWGDQRAGAVIQVGGRLYEEVEIGGPICLKSGPGALGSPWYRVRACGS